jgi:acyl dehydratase
MIAAAAQEDVMTIIVRGFDGLKAMTGQHLGYSDWLEVTQDRVNMFADATNDHQWIHVDIERAKSGPFGGPIAHGYLTLSLLIPLWIELLELEDVTLGVNYGLNKVRFPAPLPVGAKVRLGATLAAVTEVPGGVEALVEAVVESDAGVKPVCVAQVVYRYYA